MTSKTTWTPAEIAAADFCIGCGLCQSALGAETIRLEENDKGLRVPVEHRALTGAEAEAFSVYCPGANMTAPAPAEDARHNPMWGNMRLSRQVYAGDASTRFRSASGGALTGLCRHLLASKIVGFIQHVRPDPERALHSIAWRSETPEQLAEGSGSRYAPTSPLTAFHDALDVGRPFAFVGRPCDVMAIRQLAMTDRRVKERCRYLMTFMCGGTSEFQITTGQLEKWGTSEAALSHFSWRGNGCPGPVLATEKDGGEHRGTYFTLYGKDESAWGLFLRCKLCPDAIGLSADIVASDCWAGGAPEEDANGDPVEDAGFNYVIARTPEGEALLKAAMTSGEIVANAREIGTEDFDDVQPHQVTKRQALKARFEGIAKVAAIPRIASELALVEVSHPPGDGYEDQKAGAARRYLAR